MRDHLSVSPLGFGCAPVMGKVAKPKALRAMNMAFDLGVTHFDVARSYGFGRAEEVVGTFMKGRRDKVTVTTKFGVVPPRLSLRTKVLIPVARAVTALVPQLKSRLKRKSGQLLAERNFSASYAKQCLDQSLIELGTDYIDIYLVHEPEAALLKNADELADFMEKSIQAGKIRRWGFAYQSAKDYGWAGILGGDVIQFEGNIQTLPDCVALLGDPRQRIVTRPFSGGLEEKPALEVALETMKLPELMQTSAASLADISLALSSQLAGGSGSVLCSMFSDLHIQENTQSFGKYSRNEKMTLMLEKIMNSYSCMPNL